MVKHRTFSKVTGSDPAGGKLFFNSLFFLHICIRMTSDNIPFALPVIIVCKFSAEHFVTGTKLDHENEGRKEPDEHQT